MQSQYHNLPSFGGCSEGASKEFPYACTDAIGKSLRAGGCPCPGDGKYDMVYVMEMNGAQYRAKDISYSLEPDLGRISMDIADAYPGDGIHSYRRTATLKKGDGIVIHDVYVGTKRPVVLSLMTYEKPVWDENTATLGIGGWTWKLPDRRGGDGLHRSTRSWIPGFRELGNMRFTAPWLYLREIA